VDLARVTLVYRDAATLRDGLQHVMKTFEVANVMNHYQKNNQSLLGERFVLNEGLNVPHLCEIRLEEESFFSAREKSEPHLQQIRQTFQQMFARRNLDSQAVAYLVQWVLRRPKPSHALTVFRRHLARRFGSPAVAWRRNFGNARHVPFEKFREVCFTLNCRDQVVDHWQELDSGRGGCISLFELDSDAVMLLARFRAHLMGLTEEAETSPENVFKRFTQNMKLNKKGRLEAHEFRNACKLVGLDSAEADRVFGHLDLQGGCKHSPPATVTFNDLAWLTMLPNLVHIDSMTLAADDTRNVTENMRLIAWAGGRNRAPTMRRTAGTATVSSTPAAMRGRHSLIVAPVAAALAVPVSPQEVTSPKLLTPNDFNDLLLQDIPEDDSTDLHDSSSDRQDNLLENSSEHGADFSEHDGDFSDECSSDDGSEDASF